MRTVRMVKGQKARLGWLQGRDEKQHLGRVREVGD